MLGEEAKRRRSLHLDVSPYRTLPAIDHDERKVVRAHRAPVFVRLETVSAWRRRRGVGIGFVALEKEAL